MAKKLKLQQELGLSLAGIAVLVSFGTSRWLRICVEEELTERVRILAYITGTVDQARGHLAPRRD